MSRAATSSSWLPLLTPSSVPLDTFARAFCVCMFMVVAVVVVRVEVCILLIPRSDSHPGRNHLAVCSCLLVVVAMVVVVVRVEVCILLIPRSDSHPGRNHLAVCSCLLVVVAMVAVVRVEVCILLIPRSDSHPGRNHLARCARLGNVARTAPRTRRQGNEDFFLRTQSCLVCAVLDTSLSQFTALSPNTCLVCRLGH
jgi:hypothetical protein